MENVPVTTPEGKNRELRLSSISKVEVEGTTVLRRYFVRYKNGRRTEVDWQSAEVVFDMTQPKLFEDM